jgi:DNA-binding GntR family transcriptional regulator
MELFNFSSLIEDNKNSLPEQIANHILKKIFIGELSQGTRLIKSEFAKELNDSNIPVREAFYILQSTGVIEGLPRKCVRVKSISKQEMNDYTDALIELFRVGVDYSKSKWVRKSIINLISI